MKYDRVFTWYQQLLAQPTAPDVYERELLLTITENPFFFIGYEELIEQYAITGRSQAASEIQTLFLQSVTVFLQQTTDHRQPFLALDNINAASRVLQAAQVNTGPLWQRAKIIAAAWKIKKLQLDEAMPTTENDVRHLMLVEDNTEVQEMVAEIQQTPALWHLKQPAQQTVVVPATNVIELRCLPTGSDGIYTAIDGSHESIRSEVAEYYTTILKYVEQFADANNLGLGTVALVRLSPATITRRMFDAQAPRVGRVRYQLMLAGDGGVLESGTDVRSVKPGQLWKNDGRVMQRMQNIGTNDFVQVVFDVYSERTSAGQ